MGDIILKLSSYVTMLSQALAIFVITVGIIKAVIVFVKDSLLHRESKTAIEESRLELGHSFSLGLGFLIGGSILKTTIAPAWDDIGKLTVIILIRTFLNYFLTKDLDEMKNKVVRQNKDSETEKLIDL